jgi:Co/Zn/Cd efflux system component
MTMKKHLYQHEHHFNQHLPKAGELRTKWVIVLTSVTMVGEIAAGILFGSMALLADGLHMASHATALSISVLAYIYARRHAHDNRFSFGTGKVGSLAGFTSAILLLLFALVMVVESMNRFLNPIAIAFNEAILVAIIGLLVNVISIFILDVNGHTHDGSGNAHHHDHNLRAAYLHVLTVRRKLENDGQSKVTDLHIWSIGSSQYAASISMISDRPSDHFRMKLRSIDKIVHVTLDIKPDIAISDHSDSSRHNSQSL